MQWSPNGVKFWIWNGEKWVGFKVREDIAKNLEYDMGCKMYGKVKKVIVQGGGKICHEFFRDQGRNT